MVNKSSGHGNRISGEALQGCTFVGTKDLCFGAPGSASATPGQVMEKTPLKGGTSSLGHREHEVESMGVKFTEVGKSNSRTKYACLATLGSHCLNT